MLYRLESNRVEERLYLDYAFIYFEIMVITPNQVALVVSVERDPYLCTSPVNRIAAYNSFES